MPETLIPQLKDPEARQALLEAIVAVLERWEVPEKKQAELLGLPDIASLKSEKPIPDDTSITERMGHLLAIDRALWKIFPYGSASHDRWISTPDDKLGKKSPLEYMLAEGAEGISHVRDLLEMRLRRIH